MAATAKESSFADNFWGAADKGFEALIARMREGKNTCEAVLDMYQKRIEIEQEYAQKLANLAKIPIAKDELGALRDAVETVRSELETTAKARLDVAKQMKQTLEQPLAALIVNQAAGRKGLQSSSEKNLRAKQQMTQIAQQSRQNLERRVADWNAAVADRSRQPPTQSQLDQVLAVERDHNQTVAKMNEAHGRWKDEWRTACETFQKLDSDRVDFLRSSLWTYANLFSTVCVAEDEGCERVRLSLEKCDIDKDTKAFVKARGTGTDIPSPPDFPPLTIAPLPAPTNMMAAPSAGPPDTQPGSPNGDGEGGSSEDELYYEYDPYDLSVAKPTMFYVRVLYNYVPQAYEELPIQKGQFIPVVDQQEDGWWEGEVPDETGKKRRGLFPSNFVERVADQGA